MPAETFPEILYSNASGVEAVPSAPVPCSCLAANDDLAIGDGGNIDLLVDPSSTEGYVIGDGGDIDTLLAADNVAKLDVADGGTV